jgi:hypothetical protein
MLRRWGGIDSGGGQVVPAAISVTRDRGAIYALPFVLGGGEMQFGELLTAAITAHRADAAAVLPTFLEGLRLPGEDEVLAEIEQVETKLARLRERAAYLEHFRLLLGPRGTGLALEQLVIEALNVVLEGTEYSAEDRDDVGAEDFWIVGPTGDAALAEASRKRNARGCVRGSGRAGLTHSFSEQPSYTRAYERRSRDRAWSRAGLGARHCRQSDHRCPLCT